MSQNLSRTSGKRRGRIQEGALTPERGPDGPPPRTTLVPLASERSDVIQAALVTLGRFNKMPFCTPDAVQNNLETLRRALETEFGGWIALDEAVELAYDEWSPCSPRH